MTYNAEAAKAAARFNKFIADAVLSNPAEASVIRRLATAMRKAGDPFVTAWDGEESTPVNTTDSIFREAFNLDQVWLRTASGSWVFLVMGNEWDVITDYTTDLEPIVGPVSEWADNHWN